MSYMSHMYFFILFIQKDGFLLSQLLGRKLRTNTPGSLWQVVNWRVSRVKCTLERTCFFFPSGVLFGIFLFPKGSGSSAIQQRIVVIYVFRIYETRVACFSPKKAIKQWKKSRKWTGRLPEIAKNDEFGKGEAFHYDMFFTCFSNNCLCCCLFKYKR